MRYVVAVLLVLAVMPGSVLAGNSCNWSAAPAITAAFKCSKTSVVIADSIILQAVKSADSTDPASDYDTCTDSQNRSVLKIDDKFQVYWTITGPGSYQWTATGTTVQWTAPCLPGSYSVSWKLTDDRLPGDPQRDAEVISPNPVATITVTATLVVHGSASTCPGTPVTFDASCEKDDCLSEVSWTASGDADPATGTGRLFTTSWPGLGPQTVTASLGSVTKNKSVSVTNDATRLTVWSPDFSTACFDGNQPGTVAIECIADTDPPCAAAAVVWSFPSIPGVSAYWWPSNVGAQVTLYLEGLPANNSDFGWKSVTATLQSRSSEGTVALFFTRDADNHPVMNGWDPQPPNWYYYWKQITTVNFGTHWYDPGPRSYARCFEGPPPGSFYWRCYINDDGAGVVPPGQAYHGYRDSNGTFPYGIDVFAWICRHEERHRIDLTSWWPTCYPTPPVPNDADGDLIPTAHSGNANYEHDIGTQVLWQGVQAHAAGYNPADPASVPDDTLYGQGFNDCEDYTQHKMDRTWINNSGATIMQDWSCPGKQWP
jgi:hypothetical protein